MTTQPTLSGFPLTKTIDVLAVLQAGGQVKRGTRAGLFDVVDHAGNRVEAWQTAIKGAVRQLAKAKPHSKARKAVERPAARSCRVCSCTDTQACEGGCWWVEADLCSACAAKEQP